MADIEKHYQVLDIIEDIFDLLNEESTETEDFRNMLSKKFKINKE